MSKSLKEIIFLMILMTLIPLKSSAENEKSFVVSGGLAAFIGFGTGHLYANGKWTPRSTTFMLLDLAAWGLLIGIPKVIPTESQHPPPHFWAVLLLFGAEKTWQTIDSIKETKAYNEGLTQQAANLSIKLLTLSF